MLSELQKLIIGGLNLCGLKEDDIVATMTFLKTEEQQWRMVDYLEEVIEAPPMRTEVFKKAVEIAQD